MQPSIIVWGVGERTDIFTKFRYFDNCNIIGYIDSAKCGGEYQGLPIYKPGQAKELMENADYLFIANYFFSEIFEQCLRMGIPREKIVCTDWIDEPFIYGDMDRIRELAPKLERDLRLNRYKLIIMNERDTYDDEREVGKGSFNHVKYMSDYFRYRTFEFVVNQLKMNEVEGAIAEFGVFQGSFSALINQKFRGRKLYLFDTFEGFNQNEMAKETDLGRCDEQFADFHTNTSVDLMLSKLPYPEKCVVCQGFFPDSITAEAREETYAFVSIDVDFEDSVYEGLKFFYPRLAENGIIFLHDYNTAFLTGVRSAVERYENSLGHKMKTVPLADRAGTLVIIK